MTAREFFRRLDGGPITQDIRTECQRRYETGLIMTSVRCKYHLFHSCHVHPLYLTLKYDDIKNVWRKKISTTLITKSMFKSFFSALQLATNPSEEFDLAKISWGDHDILTAISHEYFNATLFWSRTPNSSWYKLVRSHLWVPCEFPVS